MISSGIVKHSRASVSVWYRYKYWSKKRYYDMYLQRETSIVPTAILRSAGRSIPVIRSAGRSIPVIRSPGRGLAASPSDDDSDTVSSSGPKRPAAGSCGGHLRGDGGSSLCRLVEADPLAAAFPLSICKKKKKLERRQGIFR